MSPSEYPPPPPPPLLFSPTPSPKDASLSDSPVLCKSSLSPSRLAWFVPSWCHPCSAQQSDGQNGIACENSWSMSEHTQIVSDLPSLLLYTTPSCTQMWSSVQAMCSSVSVLASDQHVSPPLLIAMHCQKLMSSMTCSAHSEQHCDAPHSYHLHYPSRTTQPHCPTRTTHLHYPPALPTCTIQPALPTCTTHPHYPTHTTHHNKAYDGHIDHMVHR